MSLSSSLSWTFSRSQALRGQRRNPSARPRRTRLFLEHLEGRTLLSSYSAATVSALIADITAANTAGGANTINLTAPTTSPYVLTAVINPGQPLNGGLPVIAANDNLTIVGNGDTIERSTVSGTPDFRLLAVATGGSLTLENLTLQGGFGGGAVILWAGGWLGGGGAIFSEGSLVLSGVTVQGNTANYDGGGIFSWGGSVTLEGGTIVQNNVAQAGFAPATTGSACGGGLCSVGSTVTVNNATVDNNIAKGGSGGYGGGLCFLSGTSTVNNATVDNNAVDRLMGYSEGGGFYSGPGGYGGGLYFQSLLAKGVPSTSVNVTLANDTVESNTSTFGGGLYVKSGTVTLTNDTVSSNTALVGYGGGIYIYSGAIVYLDSFTVAHTINNTDDSGLNGRTANIYGTYILT